VSPNPRDPIQWCLDWIITIVPNNLAVIGRLQSVWLTLFDNLLLTASQAVIVIEMLPPRYTV
jgi:hypothetical protein